ncbi:hypothetical protein NXS19_011493 [Fusarium pseudograminearum]|uniref:Histone chaperone domain-containing protein n=1 Tax=Fusarium pseudograminearum (strain CS3096) TaxID=1028729 RepID=K3VRJ2_FUSPC|nr:hypothetical protein FPSE_01668 [Fusarium pseudograminearum CS3096]EKJ78207.1 hypothetical protein FPSE_01668 [Fusarium pseudograminearum CS3096]KAF0637542.1 hypothetical protein FPSE5266_01668 [Fusarium pseudograminearum]UZP43681.1 hypothetical protein NXS19_011493 [Fusarium pseudograminearum]
MSDLENAPSASYEDNSYVSRPGEKDQPIAVQADSDRVEDPINAEQADTDVQLERDEKDAIDQSNIIEERTRGATQPGGTYQEPGDEEGLPSDDGTSSV